MQDLVNSRAVLWETDVFMNKNPLFVTVLGQSVVFKNIKCYNCHIYYTKITKFKAKSKKGWRKMKFGIVSDSSCDLNAEYTQREQVSVVSFYVSFDGEHYLKEGKEAGITEFYQKMADNPDCYPKTSMPSIQDYMDAFRPFAEQGMPVLCICLTKTFSGSMQSAVSAKAEIEEEFPEAEIYVMDSQLVTGLQGSLVKEAVCLRNAGLELDEAVRALEDVRATGHIFFTTKDLKYLEHGGRIGKAACLAGSMLNIKPILQFYDKELGSTELCRGRKKSLHKIIEKFLDFVEKEKINLEEYSLMTGQGLAVEDYEVFKEELRAELHKRGFAIDTWDEIQIGATIGVHTGPYPLGVGILKKCER